MVFDSAGNPAISYYEVSRGNLKYARWDGTTWVVSVPDSVNDVGSYSSLASDNVGNPAISYYDATNGDLKFCRWNGQTWVTTLVDAAGDVGSFSSLAFDASGYPGIGYYDATNGYLKCAYWNGSTWVIEIVDSVGDVGSYCSMAFDCLDGWAISYYDATNGDLKYAHGSGANWEVQVVDSVGQVGLYTSLEFDSSRLPAISYHDASKGMLKLARWNGQKWNLETIEATQAAGHWTSLAFNHCGSLAMTYDSPITGDLKYASPWNPPASQPVNQSPPDGVTCVSLTPTLQCGAFSDSCTDTHWASQWVIATDNCATKCDLVFDSGIDRSNLLQVEIPRGVLQPSTIYYWSVRHRDCGGVWSGYSVMTRFTTSSPPQQAVNVSPANGAVGISMTPTLESSAFSGSDAGDNHVATQWQITSNQGDYTAPLFDQTTQSQGLTQITIPADKLSNRTTYYWRVRYQGSCGGWSEFSLETSFFVDRNPPEAPVNQQPTDGVSQSGRTLTLQASPFVDPDAGDSHQSSQWRVTKTRGDYSTPVFESSADTTNLTRIVVPSGKLDYDTTYYWQVRYQDSEGGWSSWSAETGFSTGAAPSVPAALLMAAAVVGIIAVAAMTAPLMLPM